MDLKNKHQEIACSSSPLDHHMVEMEELQFMSIDVDAKSAILP